VDAKEGVIRRHRSCGADAGKTTHFQRSLPRIVTVIRFGMHTMG
jgi:hypothetical protein